MASSRRSRAGVSFPVRGNTPSSHRCSRGLAVLSSGDRVRYAWSTRCGRAEVPHGAVSGTVHARTAHAWLHVRRNLLGGRIPMAHSTCHTSTKLPSVQTSFILARNRSSIVFSDPRGGSTFAIAAQNVALRRKTPKGGGRRRRAGGAFRASVCGVPAAGDMVPSHHA